MAWYSRKINRYLLAVVMVVLAAVLRIWPLDILESKLAWITFYPSVMIVAIYGGLPAGLLATGLTCVTVMFFWPLLVAAPFINDPGDWVGMSIFTMTCTIMSGIAESMLRAKKYAEISAASYKDSEARFRALFNNTAISMIVIDEQGLIEEFNPAGEAIFAYSKGEVIGQDVNMLIPVPFYSEYDGRLKNHLAVGERKFIGMELEIFGKRKGNVTFPIELLVDKVNLGNRCIFVCFIKDISIRKQMVNQLHMATYQLEEKQIELEMRNNELQDAHIALEESFDRYVDLFDFAPIGYLTLTDKGLITEINLTGATLLGVDRNNVLHRHIGCFLAPEEYDRWQLHNLRTLKHKDKQSCELALQRDDGTVFHALLDCQRKDTSTSPMVRVSFTDITERKQLQQQLQQAQKMEALGQLTGGIAHDFNNILAAILGYSNLALARCVPDPSDKLARYLGEVISASERARDLIAKMLAYTRTSSVAAKVPLDMIPELEKAVAMLSVAIPAGIDVVTRIDPHVPLVRIDPIEVQQVLINLAVNARDAIGEHGRIDIALECTRINCKTCAICNTIINGDYVVLEVKDSGSGIPANIQQRIFDPFFTTKEIGKGSGLGLSMVQGVITKNNAHLLIENSSGQGTSFKLLFPFADAEAIISATPISAPIAPVTKPWRIWVVEDQECLADYYLELLQEQGYRVTVFTDPIEALRAFRLDSDSVDLILTDQGMPHLNGTELADAMLAIKPELPVILVTGYGETIVADKAKSLGIRRCLHKPVDGEKLLGILAAEQLEKVSHG